MLGAGSVLLPWDLNSPLGTTALITEGAQTQDTAVFLGALEMQIPRFYARPTESDSQGGTQPSASQQDFRVILEETKI